MCGAPIPHPYSRMCVCLGNVGFVEPFLMKTLHNFLYSDFAVPFYGIGYCQTIYIYTNIPVRCYSGLGRLRALVGPGPRAQARAQALGPRAQAPGPRARAPGPRARAPGPRARAQRMDMRSVQTSIYIYICICICFCYYDILLGVWKRGLTKGGYRIMGNEILPWEIIIHRGK